MNKIRPLFGIFLALMAIAAMTTITFMPSAASSTQGPKVVTITNIRQVVAYRDGTFKIFFQNGNKANEVLVKNLQNENPDVKIVFDVPKDKPMWLRFSDIPGEPVFVNNLEIHAHRLSDVMIARDNDEQVPAPIPIGPTVTF